MNKNVLSLAENAAKEMLAIALKEYVKKHGIEMNSYFYNEYGMYEEDDGEKIVSVLDTAHYGCHFCRQFKVNDDSTSELKNLNDFEVYDMLEDAFTWQSYWAFYIVRDKDGNERLKYYRFYNNGICYDEDAEPDHDYVDGMSLADLHYIFEAITKNE